MQDYSKVHRFEQQNDGSWMEFDNPFSSNTDECFDFTTKVCIVLMLLPVLSYFICQLFK